MGGYPKIACVIEPDLWRLGQARPGDKLRFRQVDLAEARAAEAAETGFLDSIRRHLADLRDLRKVWS